MLYVVGFGSGARECMTASAEYAMKQSDLIVGYKTYTALIKPFFPDKQFIETGCGRRPNASGLQWNMRKHAQFR